MSSTRPEISKRNKYYISKHRFYELKHFCLQDPEWKKAYHALDGYSNRATHYICEGRSEDVVAEIVSRRQEYLDAMKMVEQAAYAAEPDLASYILRGVTEGLGYDSLYGIPCSKDMYYDRYRRFFWLLSASRKIHSV